MTPDKEDPPRSSLFSILNPEPIAAPPPVPVAAPPPAPVAAPPVTVRVIEPDPALLERLKALEERTAGRAHAESERIAALERELRAAQQQATAAMVSLKEREEAQKSAQRDMEALMKSMAESRRAEEAGRLQNRRIEELESRLFQAANLEKEVRAVVASLRDLDARVGAQLAAQEPRVEQAVERSLKAFEAAAAGFEKRQEKEVRAVVASLRDLDARVGAQLAAQEPRVEQAVERSLKAFKADAAVFEKRQEAEQRRMVAGIEELESKLFQAANLEKEVRAVVASQRDLDARVGAQLAAQEPRVAQAAERSLKAFEEGLGGRLAVLESSRGKQEKFFVFFEEVRALLMSFDSGTGKGGPLEARLREVDRLHGAIESRSRDMESAAEKTRSDFERSLEDVRREKKSMEARLEADDLARREKSAELELRMDVVARERENLSSLVQNMINASRAAREDFVKELGREFNAALAALKSREKQGADVIESRLKAMETLIRRGGT